MSFFQRFNRKLIDKAKGDDSPYFAYALFQSISNPIYYLLWYCFDNTTYESFSTRILINILCFPLLFHEYWSQKLLKFLPHYWHITILYSLPFFFTFMLLKNNFSYEWSLNSLTGFVLCIIFIDVFSLLFLLPLGVGLASFCYHLSTIHPFYPLDRIQPVLITYTSIIIFGKLFVIRNGIIQQEKLKSLRSLAGVVAHEMRTPLFAIASISQRLKKSLPTLINAYKAMKLDEKNRQKLDEEQLEFIYEAPLDIEKVNRRAFAFIDILLMNLKEDFKEISITVCSIKQCVEESIKGYPLTKEEKRLVICRIEEDFEFRGNDLLMRHVFFNLLKNSIYYVKAANKGTITITSQVGKDTNKLYFKDTGKGISPEVLSQIFNKFYSKTKYGTGIGLSFCKTVMQSLNADIICKSIEGEFTEFTLVFPVVQKS